MDNALYHSVKEEGTSAPTSGTRKGDMQTWLTEHNIPFDIKLLKPQLYKIIKKCKPEPKFKVDEFLKQHGHDRSNSITKQKWKNACSHVIKEIEPKFWKSDNIQAEIPSFIINLDSDSDTDESEAE